MISFGRDFCWINFHTIDSGILSVRYIVSIKKSMKSKYFQYDLGTFLAAFEAYIGKRSQKTQETCFINRKRLQMPIFQV